MNMFSFQKRALEIQEEFEEKSKQMQADFEKQIREMESDYKELEHKAILAIGELKKINESDSLRYISIKQFNTGDREFVRRIAAIQESEEFKFLLYDLKQQCVEDMVNGNVEVNIQRTGILKGIDIVMKNLNGYKNHWDEILQSEADHGAV